MALRQKFQQYQPARFHYCPACGEPAQMVMRMPGRRMFGTCANGHSHPKIALRLKVRGK